MIEYRAPLRDMRFVLHELHGLSALQDLTRGDQVTADAIDPILDAAARFCERELSPLRRSGDAQGCRFEHGSVRTPSGFREAFRAFSAGGWLGIAADIQFGGAGLPLALRALVDEMTCSANLQFASYTNLIYGAYALLVANASAELKNEYLPKLTSGAWAATMCLTEPQSGSDLTLLASRALPADDGTYRIGGEKAFISAGDHDLTDNIVHLVLARRPDAPPGTRGISLFLVPKFVPGPDGAPRRNGVHCMSLEEKMGMRGSATCSMRFDDARGFLVGDAHRGLQAMFAMLNSARLGASLQGLGIAEAAYQQAARYARERLQGRFPDAAKYPRQVADPIIVHPDIRRMLLIMRAYIEGMRALAQRVAQALDVRTRHADPARRAAAEGYVSLMTPVMKAAFTDFGSECANLGVQILGGAGYVRRSGMEQHVRDVRVTQIYDGTNGIQALDLVQRKLARDKLQRHFFDPARLFLAGHGSDSGLAEYVKPFARSLDLLQTTTDCVLQLAVSRPAAAATIASDYLRLFALAALGFEWTAMAAVALPCRSGPEADFYEAKLATARFYLARLVPQCEALAAMILSPDRTVLDFAEAAF